MKHRVASSLIAATLLAVVIGCIVQADYVRRGEMGREAFIAHEMWRYDHYYVNRDPAICTIPEVAILVGGLFAVYEVMAFGIYKLNKRISQVDKNK